MFDKVKQLMDMKKQADQIKRELDASVIEANEVRGIKVFINGSQEVKAIEIDGSLVKAENKAMLERDLLRSLNAAIKKSQSLAAQKMKELMPGLPGLS